MAPRNRQGGFDQGLYDPNDERDACGFGMIAQLDDQPSRALVDTAIAALSLWQMSHWSLAMGMEPVIVSGLVQGLGMGLIFIPLNTMAFATIAPQFRTDGSSLLNLFRSLGASAGIAWMTVLLARNLQTAHADLGANVTAATGSIVDFSTIDRFQALGDTAMTLLDARGLTAAIHQHRFNALA